MVALQVMRVIGFRQKRPAKEPEYLVVWEVLPPLHTPVVVTPRHSPPSTFSLHPALQPPVLGQAFGYDDATWESPHDLRNARDSIQVCCASWDSVAQASKCFSATHSAITHRRFASGKRLYGLP